MAFLSTEQENNKIFVWNFPLSAIVVNCLKLVFYFCLTQAGVLQKQRTTLVQSSFVVP